MNIDNLNWNKKPEFENLLAKIKSDVKYNEKDKFERFAITYYLTEPNRKDRSVLIKNGAKLSDLRHYEKLHKELTEIFMLKEFEKLDNIQELPSDKNYYIMPHSEPKPIKIFFENTRDVYVTVGDDLSELADAWAALGKTIYNQDGEQER